MTSLEDFLYDFLLIALGKDTVNASILEPVLKGEYYVDIFNRIYISVLAISPIFWIPKYYGTGTAFPHIIFEWIDKQYVYLMTIEGIEIRKNKGV